MAKRSKHCAVGTHQWTTTPKGVRHCAECKLVPCADVMAHFENTEFHPVPITQPDGTHYPPEYIGICGLCKEQHIWAPLKGATSSDPGVIAHRYNELARQHGHAERDVETEDAAQFKSALDLMARNATKIATPRAPEQPPLPKAKR